MRIAAIQFHPWDKIYNFEAGSQDYMVGDYVVVETKMGIELGKIVGFDEMSDEDMKKMPEPMRPITRKANKDDLEKALELKKNKARAFAECKGMIKKNNLPIKLVDVHFSFDDSRVTFAFIADGRVDFRELLKDLNRVFKKNIRLQQIGIRDEMKINGDTGACGRNLCCQTFYKDLGNVTSDLADLQQVAHRGSERLSGVCGRLKCCLNYEKDLYNSLADKLPLIGEQVKTPHGKGQVISWHVLKQTVDVLLDDKETIVEFQIE